jgi:arylsulfatase A-like enzyme
VHVRATNMDLLPTLMDLAGMPAQKPADPNAQSAIEGGSLVAALKDGSSDVKRPREGIVIHFPHYDLNNGGPASAIYLDRWKLVRNDEQGKVSLYDIAKDRSESSDVASEHPDVVKDLQARLDAYLKDVRAQLAKVNTAPGAGTGSPPSRPGGQGGQGGGKGGQGGGKGKKGGA